LDSGYGPGLLTCVRHARRSASLGYLDAIATGLEWGRLDLDEESFADRIREYGIPRCWRYACFGCGEVLGIAVRLLVYGGALHHAAAGRLVAFSTFTEWGTPREPRESRAALVRLLASERKRARRSDALLSSVFVPELQKRGAVHHHGLVALDLAAVDGSFLKLGESGSPTTAKKRAVKFGFGHQADVQHLEVESLRDRAGYVAKYVTKAVRGRSVMPDGMKRYQASESWWPGWTVRKIARGGFVQAREIVAELEGVVLARAA
jgi:hypothetical protein